MSPNHSASRWYAYNARPDLLKPKVTIHDATVKRFEALFTAPPTPVFIPQKPACNVAPRSLSRYWIARTYGPAFL
jgi:hypothetical protein